MRRLGALACGVVILGACVPLLPTVPAGAASNTKNQTPWAGFTLVDTSPNNMTVTTASWVVPQVTCKSGETSYASEWVGLGGDFFSFFQKILGHLGGTERFEPLYQAGTNTNCSDGKPIYNAWEEIYAPGQDKPQIILKGAVVQRRDLVSVSLSFDAKRHTGTWRMVDSRSGSRAWSHSGAWSDTPAGFHTAECIVEDPLTSKGRAPLANFGMTSFDGCTASSSVGHASVTSATLPGHWTKRALDMKIGSSVLAVARYNPLRVVKSSPANSIDLQQVAAGNYTSLIGNWTEEAHAYNPQDGTGVHWESGGSDTLSISASNMTFGGTTDSLAGTVQGNTLTTETANGQTSSPLSFQNNGSYLDASLADQNAAINWAIGFYPKGTVEPNSLPGAAFEINGVTLDNLNTIYIWTSNNSIAEVFSQTVPATNPDHSRVRLS